MKGYTPDTYRYRLRRKSEYLNFPAITCFLLPLLTIPRVEFIGTLMLADLVVLVILPVITFNGRFYLSQPFLKPLLILVGLWLLGALFSDVYHGTLANDYLRGWAKIILFGCYISLFFILLNGKRERYSMLLMGMALSFLMRWVSGLDIYQTGSFFGQAWKFGNGMAVMMLLSMFVHARLTMFKGPVLIAFSVIHLFLNARSLFLISFITGVLVTISSRVKSPKRRLQLGGVLLAGAIVILPVSISTYGLLAENGFFGQTAKEKHEMQTTSGTNIILGARSEILISLSAIADAPLSGHGSWAKSAEYRFEFFSLKETLGFNVNWTLVYNSMLIPSHSHLFGSWVEHGILGVLFWGYAFTLLARALYLGILGTRLAEPLELLIIVYGLWSIIFSPFGMAGRVYMAVSLAVAANVVVKHMQTKKAQ